MNRFGKFARDAWQTLAPAAYQQIEDPNRHFSTLGDQAMEAWTDLWPRLAGPDHQEEGYLEKVGRLKNAQLRAEEMVREDWLLPPTELRQDPDDLDEPLDPNDPQTFSHQELMFWASATPQERESMPALYRELLAEIEDDEETGTT